MKNQGHTPERDPGNPPSGNPPPGASGSLRASGSSDTEKYLKVAEESLMVTMAYLKLAAIAEDRADYAANAQFIAGMVSALQPIVTAIGTAIQNTQMAVLSIATQSGISNQ